MELTLHRVTKVYRVDRKHDNFAVTELIILNERGQRFSVEMFHHEEELPVRNITATEALDV